MSSPSADANLLFGILALQNNFISREALLAAFAAWVADKSQPLGDLLLRDGKLTKSQLTLLTALVAELVSQHGDSPEKCLEQLSTINSMRTYLQALHDPDLTVSLQHVARRDPPNDAHESQSYDSRTIGSSSGGGVRSSNGTRFRIIRTHARGGLGEVFVAHDMELGREVALKEIQLDKAGDLDARSRFTREAEITGGLEHPSIVPVYGLGQYDDGRPYYAMRFIKGDSLKDAIRAFHAKHSPGKTHPTAGTPQPPREAERNLELRRLLQRFIDVCEAIEYAHSRGVLHRDLKPGNIMLGKYGETLVVDWGLAKVNTSPTDDPEQTLSQSREQQLRPSSGDSSATMMGSALGTPQFMPPEQAQGRIDLLGPRSDVYSLGATLYSLLTNKPPVDGKDLQTVLAQVIAGDIKPPRAVERSISRPLEAICLKALARDPDARYQSAKLLSDDLEKWLADEAVLALPETTSEKLARWTRRNRHWVQAGGLALLLVALTAVGAYFYQRETARQNLDLANEKGALAATNQQLAKRESAAREHAEASATSLREALATSYFSHGITEYAQGRLGNGALDLQRAWSVLPNANGMKRSYEAVLIDRLTRGNSLRTPPLRHDGRITAVSYSPQGDRVVTASSDGSAKLWNTHTGAPLGAPLRHDGTISAVAFSPDGEQVLTGSMDGTARLWDAHSGAPHGSPLRHDGGVNAVCFSPQGDRIVTGSADKVARVWNVDTSELIGAPLQHRAAVLAVAFSPRGGTILTGSADMTARLWDAQTSASVGEPLQHQGIVCAVTFSPEGDRALTASFDRTARLWDTQTLAPLGQPLQHKSGVAAVAFSPQGDKVLTGSYDKTARVWNARTGAPLGIPLPHTGVVFTVAFSPLGDCVLTGSWDQTAQLWDAQNGTQIGEPLRHDGQIAAAAFSPRGDSVLTGTDDKVAYIWNARADVLPRHSQELDFNVAVSAISPTGDRVVTARHDSTAALWDTRAGTQLGSIFRHQGKIAAVAFSPLGDLVVTGSLDQTARLWDARTGAPVGKPMLHDHPVAVVAFDPKGMFVATGGSEKAARLWNARTGASFGNPMRHDDEISAVAFSPQGDRLATGSRDKTARLWDVSTGRLLMSLRHGTAVTKVVFSPTGDRVLTVDSSNIVRLWSAKSGTLLFDPMRHNGFVAAAAFSPQEDRVLTGSWDRTARLWDAKTGVPLGEPMRHDDFVLTVAFNSEGDRVLTGSRDKNARLWDAYTGAALGIPLRHVGAVEAVAFSPKGNQIVTAGAHVARVYPLSNYPLPNDRTAYLELLSGHGTSQDASVRALRASEIDLRWQSLSSNEPEWLLARKTIAAAQSADLLRSNWLRAISSGDRTMARVAATFLINERNENDDFQSQLKAFLEADAYSILNGHFDQEGDGASAAFWVTRNWRPSFPRPSSIYREADGNNCLVLRAGQEGNDVSCCQRLALKAHTDYEVTCRARTKGVTGVEEGRFGAGLAIWLQPERSDSLEGTTDWTPLTLRFNSGNRTVVDLGPRLGHEFSTVSGEAWFDDVTITEVPTNE